MEKEKESKVESRASQVPPAGAKEVKKLDDVKDSPENKKAIAESEGTPLDTEDQTGQGKKNDSVETKFDKKKGKKGEVKVELEREYVVPLKRGVLNVPRYRRAKKAVRVLKEFMVRHMRVRDRDLGKVKVDINLNNEIWFRGIKKPMNKVKVKAKKVDGIVYVELAEIPAVVGFKIAREEKALRENRKSKIDDRKKGKGAEEKEIADKDGDGVADKKEEKEDVAAGAEKAAKVEKAVAKEMKHTTKGSHGKKVMPVRKALKK